ncbi:hemicentin-1-like isoform X2 [Mya arenaria]|uniref:hemicentin-1-like isoform X2 n=1 Tax=Mya arenaria TaxID=6604 RepID=UPI0022E45FF6|nr:hemicentin-1-like isoform X2 [Mya arenaria]
MRDNKLVKVFQWNVLHLLLTIAGTQGVFLLTSDKQYAQLQGDITLTCNTSDSDVSVEFNKDNKYVGRCIFSCETLNATKFSVNKVNKTEHVGYSIFTLTVKNFEVNDEGSYTCATKEQSQVSNIQITYAVNITSVTLTPRTDPISVIENVTQRFRCETSRCRPDALITWFLGSTQLTAAIESSTSQEVTTSTIDHTPQKNQHDMNIFCRGDNGGQLQTSEQPRLNVLYGPNEPVCKLGGLPLSSAVTVKEGWEFRLDCSSDGNPSPSFSWTHPGDGPSYPLFIRSINRTHAGIFRIIARSNLIPSEQKAVNLTKDIYVKVEVQYPPDLPSCRVGSTAVSSNIISAIRGNTITITCSCDSNPSSTYSWSLTGVSTTTSGQSLDLLVQKATTITLTMKNSMQFTNKSTEQGRRQSPINVQVLFPPRTPIFHLGRMTGAIITDNTLNVIRGKVTTVICESSANPPPTYTWNGNNHTMTFTPTVDETMSCCVRNKMVTTGYGTVSGNNSSVLKVNVLFAPTFPTFHFGGRTGANITGNSLSVIRGNITTVTCESTANPMPAYTWNGDNNTWTFSPTGDENKTCTVRNSMVTTRNETVFGNNSSILNINILYPPSTPTFHLGGRARAIIPDNTLNVIRGNVTIVLCQSSANPSPTYKWNGNNNTLTFTPTVDENKTCSVNNSMVTTEYGTVPGYNSSILKVNVLFAPTFPTFHFGGGTGANIRGNSLSVIRGNITSVTCQSIANPMPAYTWNGNNRTWTFTPTDDENKTCTVRNSMVTTRNETVPGYNSSILNIKILYPPSTPSFHFGVPGGEVIPDNTLYVSRGNITSVICRSSANPPPTYTWNENNHTLTFKPTDDENRTCIVYNSMVTTEYGPVSGYNSSVLSVSVLYPPGTPDLSFPSCLGEPITVNTSIKVIQGQPVNVTCSASSRPAPTYSWSRHQSKQSNVMWIPNAQTSHQGTYTCKAENIMDFTFGGPIGTNSSKHFHLEVLMPPMVNPLTNVVVLERGNVSVVCQVTDGVPNKTEFKWEKMSDMTPISMEQTLSIDNIDRKQGGNYTCTASNLMRPTGCNATVGNSSNTVNIDVQYEAEVTNFTVSNFNHGQNIEVDENTQVIFYCQVQSNPLSNISMLKETQDLKTASHTNDLEFTISKSVCEDEGTYHCTTQYAHNTEADIRSLTLFVRCAPRASSLASRNQSITRSTGVPAVFTLKLVAFPRPRVADIIWEKNVSDRNTWVIVRNDTDIDILISEDGLQTQLSFSSVKEDDFGYYRVHVNNELGNYTESFRLQAQEHPHSPSSLQHFQKATVDTIHIEWTPGFDGGLPQTFYIEYREVGASVWREERGIAGQINYTIVGLNPATMYEIRVYSTNDIGRSNASEAITASTLKTPESGRPPVVLISVLVIVVCVVFAVVVIIVVIKKRLKGKNTADMDRLTMHHNLQSLGNPNTDGTDDDEDDEVINPIYDGGNTIQDEMNKTEALYSQPQKKKAVSVASGVGDTYAVVNKKPKGKPGTKHPSKPKKKSTNTEDVYENVGYQRGATGSTTSHGIDTYENHDVPLARKAAKRNVNADGLIYADLEFPNLPKGQQRFVIHGSDNMTDYATVDLTKKAEPLPESDDDESKSPSK